MPNLSYMLLKFPGGSNVLVFFSMEFFRTPNFMAF